MHEELDRPLRAEGEEGECPCVCNKTRREGEADDVESVRDANFVADLNDIGG